MKVLIIEDSDYKIQSLHALVTELIPNSQILIAKSFQSGKRALKEFRPDLLLLDMTIQTSELPNGQPEGRNRIFGGREILTEMEFLDICSKVVVVTQFDHFGEPPHSIDFRTLFAQLKHAFPNTYCGGVYYNNVDSSWQEELRNIIIKITKSKL